MILVPILRHVLAALAVAGALAWPAAQAQTPGGTPRDPATVVQVSRWNAECLSCHSPTALHALPRQDLDVARLSRLLTDPVRFAESNHAGMACRTCHLGGLRGFPHSGPDQAVPGRAETLQCAECHARQTWHIEAQAARGVHARNLGERFTCSTCHDPHVFQTAARLREPERIVAQDNAMCISCHDSDQRLAEFGGTLTPGRSRPNIDAIHSWLPNARRHWASVRCVECHTPPSPTRTLAISHQILDRSHAQRDCVTCHSTNTALRAGLYRHVAEEQSGRLGFLNSALVERAYVIGATRNSFLDRWGLLLLAAVTGGVLLHGALRFVLSRFRRSPR